jgi:anti-sigma B factor antagonist
MTLTLERSHAAGWTVLRPAGQIDAATAGRLRAELEQATSADARVIVDLGAVDFLDSTGLGVLIGGLRRARVNGGALRVVCTERKMLELFRVTGLTDVLDVHQSCAEALRAPLGDRVSNQGEAASHGTNELLS